MTTFREQWLEVSGRKGSSLCAGLDPSEHESFLEGEKIEEFLPEGVDKRKFMLDYTEAVLPYVAAIKPNGQFVKAVGDEQTLRDIKAMASAKGVLIIDDSKIADIGSTNRQGIYHASRRAHAVTFSPFLGNLEEAVGQAHKREIGLISMCLMTHPQFKNVKNNLVLISEADYERYGIHADGNIDMALKDYKMLDEEGVQNIYVRQYIQLAHDARKFGADGIVVGAPSPKNHLTEREVKNAARYAGRDMLILMPGLGKQLGDARMVYQAFDPRNIMGNYSRDLMFPNNNTRATPAQQAEKARELRDLLNSFKAA